MPPQLKCLSNSGSSSSSSSGCGCGRGCGCSSCGTPLLTWCFPVHPHPPELRKQLHEGWVSGGVHTHGRLTGNLGGEQRESSGVHTHGHALLRDDLSSLDRLGLRAYRCNTTPQRATHVQQSSTPVTQATPHEKWHSPSPPSRCPARSTRNAKSRVAPTHTVKVDKCICHS